MINTIISESQTLNPRYDWLDVAKGIAIILMVLGHTSIPAILSGFIWAFHMPLFFIASGFCTDWGKDSFLNFFIHKSKVLLIPFFVYSSIVLAVGVSTNLMTAMPIILHGWASICYPLWFIPILYLALLLSKVIMSIPKQWVKITIWILLAIIGSILKYYKIYLPWTLSPVFYASFLIIAGSYSKRFINYIVNPKWGGVVLSFILTFIISYFWKTDLSWNAINPVLFITIGAFAGTYMTFSISSVLSKHLKYSTCILSLIGKETYIIMAFSSLIPSVIDVMFSVNDLIKYIISFLLLYVFIVIKNGINKLFKTKVLY